MTRLKWNTPGDRFYETGVDRGVLYIDGKGVPWSGITSVVEVVDGGDPKQYYLDGQNYRNIAARQQFKATIKAFFSPPEFDACDGVKALTDGLFVSQQKRKSFGFSYRSKLGNDLEGVEHGSKIHLVYNALAAPSERSYNSMSNEINLEPLSWDIVSKPVKVPGAAPSAHLVIDTSKLYPWVTNMLEDILYGDESTPARLPQPEEILTVIQDNSAYELTVFENGTFTIAAPDAAVRMVAEGQWELDWDAARYISDDTYVIETSDVTTPDTPPEIDPTKTTFYDSFNRTGEPVGSVSDSGKIWGGTSGIFTMNGQEVVNDQAKYGGIIARHGQVDGILTAEVDLNTKATNVAQQLRFYFASDSTLSTDHIFGFLSITITGGVTAGFYQRSGGAVVWNQAFTATQIQNMGIQFALDAPQIVKVELSVSGRNIAMTITGPNGVSETISRVISDTDYAGLGTYAGIANASAAVNPGLPVTSFKLNLP